MIAGRSQHGFVLICVMWILAILTVITLGFGRRAMLDFRASSLGADVAQARAAAQGAVWYAIADLQRKNQMEGAIRGALENNPDDEAMQQMVKGYDNPFRTYDIKDAVPSMAEDEAFEDDVVSYTLEDEERRWNLNEVKEQVLEEAEEYGLEDIDAILERAATQSEGEKQPFVAMEELLFTCEIEPETWKGAGDEDLPGLQDLFTVWGDGLLNVNTASPAALALVPGLDEGAAEAIGLFLAGEDEVRYTNDDEWVDAIADLGDGAGLEPAALSPLANFCKTRSEFFRIVGTATRRQGRVRAECTAVCRVVGFGDPNQDFQLFLLAWKENVSGG